PDLQSQPGQDCVGAGDAAGAARRIPRPPRRCGRHGAWPAGARAGGCRKSRTRPRGVHRRILAAGGGTTRLWPGQYQSTRSRRLPGRRARAPDRCARLRADLAGEFARSLGRARPRFTANNAHRSHPGEKPMIRWMASILGLAIVLSPALAQADDDDNASALVTVAKLQEGGLPISVTAFGQVQPRDTAQQTVSAPLSVRVANVSVRAGMHVPAGTPMMTLVPTPESHASYVQAKLAARLASQVLERDRSMVQAHLLTQAELLKAENDEANAKSTLEVLEGEGAEGPKTLTAPFDALVMKVDANLGAVVAQGAPLVELAPPDSLVLEVGTVSAQAAKINPGDAATITPIGSDENIQGKVLSREALIDPATGLVPVQITFPLGKM